MFVTRDLVWPPDYLYGSLSELLEQLWLLRQAFKKRENSKENKSQSDSWTEIYSWKN